MVNFVWIDFAEKHKITKNHEAFDMMAVSCFENGLNDIINGFNAGGSGVNILGMGRLKFQKLRVRSSDPLAS